MCAQAEFVKLGSENIEKCVTGSSHTLNLDIVKEQNRE